MSRKSKNPSNNSKGTPPSPGLEDALKDWVPETSESTDAPTEVAASADPASLSGTNPVTFVADPFGFATHEVADAQSRDDFEIEEDFVADEEEDEEKTDDASKASASASGSDSEEEE